MTDAGQTSDEIPPPKPGGSASPALVGEPRARMVRAGRPSLDAIVEVLERRSDPLGPAMVVAPSALAAVALRRELALAAGGLAGVEVATLSRVATRIAEPEMQRQGLRKASGLELQAAVAAELAEHPRRFAPVANHPATHDRLVRLAAEIAGAPRPALSSLQKKGGLFGSALAVLEGASLRLRSALTADAVFKLAFDVFSGWEPGSWGPVVIFEPNPTSPGERALLQLLVARDDVAVVCVASGFASIDAAHQSRLKGFSCTVELADVQSEPFKRIEVGDPDDEVRTALGSLHAQGDTVALTRSAVLYASADPYGTLLADHADEAELPLSGPGLRPLARSIAGVTIRRLLDMTQNGVSRTSFEQFLSATVAADELDQAVTSGWVTDARDAGVVEPESWDESLSRAIADEASMLERSPDHSTAKLERLRALHAFVDQLATDCTAPVDPKWSDLSGWLERLVERYCPAGSDWPTTEVVARDRLIEMVRRMASLDDVGQPPSLSLVSAGLISQMEQTSTAGKRAGEGLLAAPISAVAGVPFSRVVVIGLADGVYPRRRRTDPMLAGQVRSELNLTEAHEAAAIEARSVAIALAASETEPLVVNSRGDLRSRRSRTWPRDLSAITADPAAVASHEQALRENLLPASLSEFELASVLSLNRSPEFHPLGQFDPALGPALGRLLAIGREFGPFTGRVPAEMVDPSKVVLSATALEDYAKCPRKYLLHRFLRLGADEVPDRIEELSGRERGSLLHDILETFLQDEIDADRVPAPSQPWDADAVARLGAIGDRLLEREAKLGRSGGRVTTRIEGRRIQRDLLQWVNDDNAHRAERNATPICTEWGFGFDGEPATVAGSDGEEIRLRGRVDRIDRTSDGGLIVIDYKSGSGSAFKKFDDPLASGTRLQLGLYAMVAADEFQPTGDVVAMYWMLNKPELHPRLLPIDDQVIARMRDYVAAARQGIVAGLFPARPGEESNFPRASYTNCQWCDVDAICPSERRVEWDRLAGQPELAPLKVFWEESADGG